MDRSAGSSRPRGTRTLPTDMNTMKNFIAIIPLLALAACSRPPMPTTTADSLNAQLAAFAPVELTADIAHLTAGDREALEKLIEAARLMDSIYLRQVWGGNIPTLERLRNDRSDAGSLRTRLFLIHMSPWSGIDDERPFIDGVPARPLGADHYPEDMTKEEFERWVSTLSTGEQEAARGYFSVIRRNDDGSLRSVPFSEAYRPWLAPAAQALQEAAAATTDPTLRRFLTARATSFLTNDYYDSDVAWMDLDSPLEPTIGPYEVYMDGLFNYKASFEAYIAIRNEQETAKLKQFSGWLQEIEDRLPIDPTYRNPKLGASAPIRVVDLVATGGEARAGVQTAAFNLPNDERVVKAKGSKRVMLRNVQEAKFQNVLTPIAAVALAPGERTHLSFEQFFTHILAHELMHGLGPHEITVNGRKTTARQEMKELSSALEEAKADIAALFALQYLMESGRLDRSTEHELYTTYLAGVFRSVRFGINEAHGKGMAVQFNYLLDEGGFVLDPTTGLFSVDLQKIKPAVTKLTGRIMDIQARGAYEEAKDLLTTYGIIRPSLQVVLDRLKGIPVDIAPTYPLSAH